MIILLAIGPTATVLSYDLADNGFQVIDFQVIDIVHLDVEYQWYLMQAKKKTPLENRTVNEVSDS
ncbi:GT-D fold domain-containing glycosyltransferase [Streptococcus thermophilus]